jgi:hypothetical protein
MLARAGVLRLERAGERGDGLPIGLLDEYPLAALDLQEVPEILGVEQHLLVLAAAALRPEGDAEAAAGEALDDGQQLERAERLAQERVGPGQVGLDLSAGFRAGQEHDCNIARGRIVLESAAELEPAHTGHAHVQDEHIRLADRDALHGATRAVRFVHLEVEDLAGRADEGSQAGIVVNKQQPHRDTPLHVAALPFGRPADSL